jgi:hypothetical protein
MEIVKTQFLNFSQKTHQKVPYFKPETQPFSASGETVSQFERSRFTQKNDSPSARLHHYFLSSFCLSWLDF